MRRLQFLVSSSFWLVFISVIPGWSQSGGPEAQIQGGKIIYEQYCLACHQADGSGVPNLNPPLIKTKWVLGEKKNLIKVVLLGMDEEIEIDGEYYNNVMPSFQHLTDEEIANVLTFVRSNFGNKASSVTVADVKSMRSTVK